MDRTCAIYNPQGILDERIIYNIPRIIDCECAIYNSQDVVDGCLINNIPPDYGWPSTRESQSIFWLAIIDGLFHPSSSLEFWITSAHLMIHDPGYY
jgi:hypothetical protein